MVIGTGRGPEGGREERGEGSCQVHPGTSACESFITINYGPRGLFVVNY